MPAIFRRHLKPDTQLHLVYTENYTCQVKASLLLDIGLLGIRIDNLTQLLPTTAPVHKN